MKKTLCLLTGALISGALSGQILFDENLDILIDFNLSDDGAGNSSTLNDGTTVTWNNLDGTPGSTGFAAVADGSELLEFASGSSSGITMAWSGFSQFGQGYSGGIPSGQEPLFAVDSALADGWAPTDGATASLTFTGLTDGADYTLIYFGERGGGTNSRFIAPTVTVGATVFDTYDLWSFDRTTETASITTAGTTGDFTTNTGGDDNFFVLDFTADATGTAVFDFNGTDFPQMNSLVLSTVPEPASVGVILGLVALTFSMRRRRA